MNVTSNFGKQRFGGWWFGVWQDGRLVGFGAGYSDKRRCFRDERRTVKAAQEKEMPTVICCNGVICQREQR